MSSVVIAGDTSGTVTLQAPAVSGSSVLTLPATTDTVAIQSQAVRQVVSSISGTYASGTTPIPFDNTIPQNIEGDQYYSVTITPKSATSTLVIFAECNVSHSATAGNTDIIMAVFQDSIANAIAAACEAPFAISANINLKLVHTMTSGTTSAITFKMRVGAGVAGTLYMNGVNGAGALGGVLRSGLVVMEIGG